MSFVVKLKLHLLEWTAFIVSSPQHTCAIIILINQICHTCQVDYLGKGEVLSNADSFVLFTLSFGNGRKKQSAALTFLLSV